MNIVFFGTGAFGLPALEAIHRSADHRLLAVVTSPDKPSGRHAALRSSPIKTWALPHGVKVIEMGSSVDSSVLPQLRALNADLFVVISFGRILKRELLDMPAMGSINVHGSLLPRYRGASPMQSAILNGETETGVSVMRMVEALDAGAVLLERKTPLAAGETILTLEPRLSVLAAEALEEALRNIASKKCSWKEQDPKKVTHCAKIRKEDGRIVWSRSARDLDRQIRAYLSWPGSYFFHKGKRLAVKKSRSEISDSPLKPGQILRASPDGIGVRTGEGCLVVEELQLEGRNSLKASEFLKGYPLEPGELLE